jgi:signal transduction histidine kinase
VKARLARQLTSRDPAKAAEMLEQIEAETQSALDDLRDLAHGIYPPLLADRGLAAALSSQAQKVPVPVTVDCCEIPRYPMEVESAIYFCVLEALQNVAKYAGASRATLRVRSVEGRLEFSIIDDGRGFDPARTARGAGTTNMKDRLEALGGMLEVRSAPGAGTTVSGWVPAAPAGSS